MQIQSAWLKPQEDSYYLSQVWKEKGYSKLLNLGTGLGHHAGSFCKEWRNIVHWICLTDINVCIIM